GEDSYGGKSLWVKTKIILAGVGVNFLIAAVLFTILSWIGIPKLLPAGSFDEEQFALASDTEIVEDKTLVSFVFEDSPAGVAGIEVGDEIVSLTDQGTGRVHPVDDGDRLWELTSELAGKRVGVLTLRDSEERLYNLVLQTEAQAEATDTGRLGVSTSDFVIQRHTWSAPINGIVLTAQYTKVTLQGLGQAIGYLLVGDTGTAKDSVTGPIGVFFVLQAGAEYGLSWVLMIIALLSLALAIINSLPIPALDGGRLALTLLFRKVLRRPLTKRIEDRIVGFSMVGLLALMVLVAAVDIERFLL
ncbi:RIP metalloprotease, partial [Candidatus Saccharibacteria bacterium]|nr:RIP metalloprotease [Candidatus Saccharibacteria bacterium]